MTRLKKLTIPKTKLKKLANAMGGRSKIAEAILMSRAAVDRYFIGKGMRQETYDCIMILVRRHVEDPATAEPEAGLVPEPPTLAEEGGHLYALLVKALQRNSGVDALQAQLTRIEAKVDQLRENQAAEMKAWQMTPAGLGR